MLYIPSDSIGTDKKLILNNVFVGIEYEFIVDSDNMVAIRNQIAKTIGENVVIYTHEERISKIKCDYSKFNLTQDYSGGAFCYELVTPKMPYQKALDITQKVFKYIEEYGYVNDSCAIHLNISFENEHAIGLKNGINKLIPLQFVCQFNEDKVYELFPERKNNVYASSIKSILPKNEYVDVTKAHMIENFEVCSTKYYGVNFKKLEKDYIEFRYLGGKKYIKKFDEIKELLQHFIFSVYNCLKYPGLTQDDELYILKQMDKYKKMLPALQSYSKFRENYKNIDILVDLKNDEKLIQFRWNQMKSALFEFLLNCGKEKGIINYDTELQRMQIKDAVLRDVSAINNNDFIFCDIKKFVSTSMSNVNTKFYECKIVESIITSADFINCELKNTKILNCNSNRLTTFDNCYIKNKDDFSGSFTGCYFVSREPNENSFIENCNFIDKDVKKYKEKEAKKNHKKKQDILKKNKLRFFNWNMNI